MRVLKLKYLTKSNERLQKTQSHNLESTTDSMFKLGIRRREDTNNELLAE